MNRQMIYMESDSYDPYFNLAFEEYVLTHYMDGDYLLLWQNDNTIVVGLNQNTEAEINRDFVEEHKIKVVRRMTGGGAVYHDLGNLNYSFITDKGENAADHMKRFTDPVVDALKGLGMDAEASGRNDILIGERKVSGTAQHIYKDRILHHGTLLFRTDPDLVAGALNADPEKFKSKSTRSVRSRIGNISDCLEREMDIGEFRVYLRRKLCGAADVTQRKLSAAEYEEIKKLQTEKYETWEWNYGRSPEFTINNKHRWPGGTLEVRTAISKGVIDDICFYGDFLAVSQMDEVIGALKGCRFDRGSAAAVLKDFDMQLYFGGISMNEILETIFA